MPAQTINGVTYHYLMRAGDEDGRAPLVLLHGFTGSATNWRPLLPAFAHYRTIAVDLLGHGRSAVPPDPERYRMDRVAADLVALLRALDALPCHLLGYSMGGRLALYTAVHHKTAVRSLLLESASPGLEHAAERQQRRGSDEQLAAFIEREGIAAFVQRWEALPLWASQAQLPEATRAQLRQQRLRNRPQGLANSLRGMGAGQQPPLWAQLPGLAMPVLLLAGVLDEKFVAIGRRMAAQLPAATLHVVPGAGHTIHLERPHTFTTAVLDFLAGQ